MIEEKLIQDAVRKMMLGGKQVKEKPTADQLANRYSFHPPVGNQGDRYEGVRSACLVLAKRVVDVTPASTEQDVALICLDAVMMFANAAIARNE